MTSPTDDELMQQACAGDKAAFGTLVERLWWSAVRYAFARCGDAYVAQDLAQEAFVRLYLSRDRYQPRARVQTLLYRILRNLAVDHSRRTRARATALVRLAERSAGGSLRQPVEVVEAKEELITLYRALRRLTPEQRTLVVLREMGGLSYRDLASVTGMSFDSVRVQLHRARRRLQEELVNGLDGAGGTVGRGVRLGRG